MIAAAWLALSIQAAQPVLAAAPPPIVVVGRGAADLRARLAACLARACPPDEDIDASLALAEGEFIDGDYDASVAAITQSLARNRRFGARYPEPVADLYRAQARVERHRGHDSAARFAVERTLEVLREGIPVEDHRHFTARLEIVEMLTRAGDFRGARRALEELARRADAAGRADIRRMAEMRRLRIDYFLDRQNTMRRLVGLANQDDPARRFEKVSARLLLAAIYRMNNDRTRSNAMLAGLPAGPRRQLLFSPPFLAEVREHARGAAVPLRVSQDFRDAWIDVGYWIGADGHVTEAEVVRQGANPSWADPLLTAIRARLYAVSPDGAPSYRLERYTLTAPLSYPTAGAGGLIRSTSRTRVEMMDLTGDAEPGRAPSVTLPAQPAQGVFRPSASGG